MPIINGTYVPQTLTDSKSAQQQVFGDYTRHDMSDYSSAAYNYLMKQQEQAYNLDLWRLQNEYDSPAAVMKRYQDAGLNPNLIYSQMTHSSAPAAASAPSFRSAGTQARGAQNAINMIGQVVSTIKAARDTYDYMKYGAETNRWNMINAQESAYKLKMDNEWNDWMLHGENMIYGDGTRLPYGPKATMYKTQMDINQKRFEQLRAVVALIPDQQKRVQALKALDDYRLEILQGQYGFINNINTGSQGLDSFLRMLGYFLLSR